MAQIRPIRPMRPIGSARQEMTIRQAAAPAIASRSQKASEPKMRTKLPWIGFLLPAALVLIWWLGAEAGYLDATFFSTPQAVVQTLGKLLFSGVLVSDFWASLQRILMGASIGFVAGLLLGAVTGYARQVERVLDPTVQALRAVPAVAWIPFLILRP